MKNNFATLEDISTKYNIVLVRKYYEKIEEDILDLFNNGMNDEILKKCKNDKTGIYYHVCAQYFHLKSDDFKHKMYNKKAVELNNCHAMYHKASFHKDISTEEKIKLFKKCIDLYPEYSSSYGELAFLLEKKICSLPFIQRLFYSDFTYTEYGMILLNGVKYGDTFSASLLAEYICYKLFNYAKARYYNKIYKFYGKNDPFIDQKRMEQRYDFLEGEINKKINFSIGYIRKPLILDKEDFYIKHIVDEINVEEKLFDFLKIQKQYITSL